jgi:hypothetical protein
VHVALPHAPRDGAAHHVQVAAVLAGRRDLVAQAVLAAHADAVVLVAVQRDGQRVRPRLLLADQVDVDLLADLLQTEPVSHVRRRHITKTLGRGTPVKGDRFYLEILPKNTRKLLSLHLVVVYPGVDRHLWVLGARYTVCSAKRLISVHKIG